jgi:hypothetical protein
MNSDPIKFCLDSWKQGFQAKSAYRHNYWKSLINVKICETNHLPRLGNDFNLQRVLSCMLLLYTNTILLHADNIISGLQYLTHWVALRPDAPYFIVSLCLIPGDFTRQGESDTIQSSDTIEPRWSGHKVDLEGRGGGVLMSLYSIINHWLQQSPSQRREAPCEGTNPPRLFTPGETKPLAKSKVHQLSRAWVTVRVSVGGHPHWSHNIADCHE